MLFAMRNVTSPSILMSQARSILDSIPNKWFGIIISMKQWQSLARDDIAVLSQIQQLVDKKGSWQQIYGSIS